MYHCVGLVIVTRILTYRSLRCEIRQSAKVWVAGGKGREIGVTDFSYILLDNYLVFPCWVQRCDVGGVSHHGFSIVCPASPCVSEFCVSDFSLVNEPFHFCCFVNSAKPFSNIGGVNTSPVYRYALGGLINVV